MDASARAYARSLAAVGARLGLDLREVDDWNCCGATEYRGLSPIGAHALVARNLALAERQRNGSDMLVAPCSACFVNLARTDHAMRHHPDVADTVNRALAAGSLHYTAGSIRVRHLVEVIIADVGIDAVARQVVRPLRGLRVAPYLGCLVSRPDEDHRWRLREHPLEFDRLLAALGAEVVDYPCRTDCCGGHLTQVGPDTGFQLIRRLVEAAERLDADVMATVCPMCQLNVDAYQGEMNRHFHSDHHMPILFFTQLMGLAFDIPAGELGIGAEVVSAQRALGLIGIDVPPPEPPADGGTAGRRSRRTAALPMPPPLPDPLPDRLSDRLSDPEPPR